MLRIVCVSAGTLIWIAASSLLASAQDPAVDSTADLPKGWIVSAMGHLSSTTQRKRFRH